RRAGDSGTKINEYRHPPPRSSLQMPVAVSPVFSGGISTPVTCRISVGVSSSRDSMLPISLRKRRPISAAVVGGAKAWEVGASVMPSVPLLRGALELAQPVSSIAEISNAAVYVCGMLSQSG